ncbi:hypothetical protein [Pseudoxanthomonas sp.]|uniref:hypothetical protein n=1 Tax=Pseudoxanthomonas sp. TaxID=1871049 RepID=UPI00260D56D3|nr:hypothetical protein [Pseudoxanthomonas sp.]WDS36231.1 MAG: hypothetical protein O8I58_18500 [Pseudoxanthomonas sp.]
MSNLLSTPGLWTDYAGATPPSYWTGSAYSFVTTEAGGAYHFQLALAGSPDSSDTFEATVIWDLPDVYEGTYGWFLNYVSNGAVVESLTLSPATGSATLNITAVAGYFVLAHYADGTFASDVQYTSSFLTITPAADVVAPPPTGGRHIPQQKTLYLAEGETRIVEQKWAGECEERNTDVASSEWSATDGGLLTGASLSGTKATVIYSPAGHRAVLTNTVVLDNGETLKAWRWVEVERHG